MHCYCLYFRKVFLMTFQTSVEVFPLFTPLWRAAVWISGATFGIYTEENILFTESGSLKWFLFFSTVMLKKIQCYAIIRKFWKIFPPRKIGNFSLGPLQFGLWIWKNIKSELLKRGWRGEEKIKSKWGNIVQVCPLKEYSIIKKIWTWKGNGDRGQLTDL